MPDAFLTLTGNGGAAGEDEDEDVNEDEDDDAEDEESGASASSPSPSMPPPGVAISSAVVGAVTAVLEVPIEKTPTFLLAIFDCGVLSSEVEPALDNAVPEDGSVDNNSAGGLSRVEIRKRARNAKKEGEEASGAAPPEAPVDQRAAAQDRYTKVKEKELKQLAYESALKAREQRRNELNSAIKIAKEEKKEAQAENDLLEVARLTERLIGLKRKRDDLADSAMSDPPKEGE